MEVIQRVFRSELKVGRAALLLGISERQCYRTKRRASKHRSRRGRRAAEGMMLHNTLEKKGAGKISEALETVLLKGEVLTRDLGGVATTKEFAQAIIREIER